MAFDTLSRFIKIATGGRRAIPLSAGNFTGEFYCITAAEDLTITSVEIDGVADSSWDSTLIPSGNVILFGTEKVTAFTVASGSGWANEL